MTLYAFDADGYLGDVATTSGWSDFCRWMRESGSDVLREFADSADAEKPSDVADALEAAGSAGKLLEPIRKTVLALSRKAAGVLLVSDGLGD